MRQRPSVTGLSRRKAAVSFTVRKTSSLVGGSVVSGRVRGRYVLVVMLKYTGAALLASVILGLFCGNFGRFGQVSRAK
jgi:hypothetical protein